MIIINSSNNRSFRTMSALSFAVVSIFYFGNSYSEKADASENPAAETTAPAVSEISESTSSAVTEIYETEEIFSDYYTEYPETSTAVTSETSYETSSEAATEETTSVSVHIPGSIIPENPVIIGDINNDKNIDALDALNILNIVVGNSAVPTDNYFIGDANGDYSITSADALIILQYIVGISEKIDSNAADDAKFSVDENNSVYGYDRDGNPLSGIKTVNGIKYGFSEDGCLIRGEFEYKGEKYFPNGEGIIENGWQFSENGKAFIKNGQKLHGWNTLYNNKYYFGDDGYAVSGFSTIDGREFGFADDCTLAKSLTYIKGIPYLFDDSGQLTSGWGKSNGKRCYFFADNTMAVGEQIIDGEKYLFGDDGTLTTGWINENGGKYYRNSFGYYVSGWQDISGKRYFFDPDTFKMAAGNYDIDGNTYLFADNGVFKTGWVDSMYYTEYGFAADGFLTIDEKLYCFTDGIYQTGDVIIDGIEYSFDDDGSAKDGWYDYTDYKMYFSGGISAKSEYMIDGEKYLFGDDGKFVSGLFEADEKTYYRNEFGYLMTGWQTIDGKKYFFDDDGSGFNGFHTINKVMYHFVNGELSVSTSVGLYNIDENGVCKKMTTVNAETAKYKADEIISSKGKDPKALYSQVASTVKYKFVNVQQVYDNPHYANWADMAAYAMNRGSGACYHFAAYLDCLYQRAGYESRIIVGTGLGSGLHCWNQVYVNDAWVNYDACNKFCGVSDSYLKGKTYTFNNYVENIIY